MAQYTIRVVALIAVAIASVSAVRFYGSPQASAATPVDFIGRYHASSVTPPEKTDTGELAKALRARVRPAGTTVEVAQRPPAFTPGLLKAVSPASSAQVKAEFARLAEERLARFDVIARRATAGICEGCLLDQSTPQKIGSRR
jgi:hypothetical protein